MASDEYEFQASLHTLSFALNSVKGNWHLSVRTCGLIKKKFKKLILGLGLKVDV